MTNKAHLNPGEMTRFITIQKPVDAPDGAGGETRTWATFIRVWASVEPNSGSETYFAQQLYPKESYTVQIRYKTGVVPGMRIVLGSHIMRIHSIIDLYQEHAFLKMNCEELQAEGAVH